MASHIYKIQKDQKFEYKINIDESRQNVRYMFGDIIFFPTWDKLTISPDKNKIDDKTVKDIGDYASKICETLPHTPIDALGHNFICELQPGQSFAIGNEFNSLTYNDMYKKVNLTPTSNSLLTHSLSIEGRKNVILNVSYTTSDKKTLSLNYHYQINNNSDLAIEVTKKYFINYEHSLKLLSNLIEG